jgi:uncharacterized membrane protein
MVPAEPVQLTADEIDAILKYPNGPYVLLDMVRMGRIDAEVAVSAIENARRAPFFERLINAIFSAISSR